MNVENQLGSILTALDEYMKMQAGDVYITPGQSLFLAILACEKNNVSSETIKALKSLYLNGVRSDDDKKVIRLIGNYLSDNFNYNITTHHGDINNDPLRRYFETHAAYNMLECSAQSLQVEKLTEFTNHLKENLYEHMSHDKREKIEYILAGNMHKSLNKYELEYAEMIHRLKSHSFHGLSPAACDNLCEIARSTILATNNTMFDKNMPADIYADSIFTMGMDGRGRMSRGEQNREGSSFKGLIREGTELPEHDIARSEQSPFLRSADQATYMIESQWSQHLFARQTHVFSNGISSTTLATLRNILMQKRLGHNHHVDDFQQYMTAFASLMIFNSGGHSLFEIFEVFKLPQLREVMVDAGVEEFLDNDTLMDEWLLEGQLAALDKAFESSSKYYLEFETHILEQQGPRESLDYQDSGLHQNVVEMDADTFQAYLQGNEAELGKKINEGNKQVKSIDLKNKSGYTPFMVAAQIGKLEHIKLLKDAGANVTRNMRQKGCNNGLSALELAIKSEKYPVVSYLLNEVSELTIKKDNSHNLRDSAPALYYACRQKDVRILEMVIDVDKIRGEKLTASDKILALLETVRFENLDGMEKLLDKFNKEGFKLNAKDQQMLIQTAAGRGNVLLFQKLLDSVAMSTLKKVNYSSLMGIASDKYYVPMMREILSRQHLIEHKNGGLSQENLEQMMNKALEKRKFDMAVLAILYGANPTNISIINNNALSAFTDYLRMEPLEHFNAFFTAKDCKIISQRHQQLQSVYKGTKGILGESCWLLFPCFPVLI